MELDNSYPLTTVGGKVLSILLPFQIMKGSTHKIITAAVLISAAIIAAFAFGYLVAQDVPTHDMPTSFQL